MFGMLTFQPGKVQLRSNDSHLTKTTFIAKKQFMKICRRMLYRLWLAGFRGFTLGGFLLSLVGL